MAAVRYRTIVADPPWDNGLRPGWSWMNGRPSGVARELPYPTMSVDEIAALPVYDLSEGDPYSGTTRKRLRAQGVEPPRNLGSALYLWTTTRYLVQAHEVAKSWGFNPSVVLVWCKPPRGFNVGGTFASNVEFVVVGRRCSPPPAQRTVPTRWFTWPRGEHSRKPEAFYDLVESVSSGPYLELFARRQRLGWDTWGDESLAHVEMVS